MRFLRPFRKRLAKDDRGGVIVEYGLLIGVLALGLIAVLGTVKTNIASYFSNVNTELQQGYVDVTKPN
ncbi:Flp family type IVb pilin [Azospirillum sp. ST 5-10]|uniref:Flp family type IVb pilin n=1 Tax=unclassified Azospirillum TaxID=2630922 RepID=UPI003F49D2E2